MATILAETVEKPVAAPHEIFELDLAFAMDCTGSMGSYIHIAQKNIRKIVEEIIASEKCDVRLALVEYRDHPPQDTTFVTRAHDFTNSILTMKGWLENCSARGGGDAPEAVADALHEVRKLKWRPNATKICVLISDAPPHGLTSFGDEFPNGCPAGIDSMEVTKQLAENGITLYSVGCEPAINPYKEFFMAIAHLTGGQYVPLRGAGLLTKVIVGGAQEEISLEKWMMDVDEEVKRELDSGRDIDEEAMSSKVQQKLNLKGAQFKQLSRSTGEALAPTSDRARQYSEYSNMKDVKRNFRENTAEFNIESDSSCESFCVVESALSTHQASRMVQKSRMRNMKK